MSETDFFPDVIGQEKAKKILSLYIKGYLKTGALQSTICISGGKGCGKSMLAREFCNNLLDLETNEPKRIIEFGGETIKNSQDLEKNVLEPSQEGPCTILIHEAHALEQKKVQTALLSILDVSLKNKCTEYRVRDGETFIFGPQISWVFTTTDMQKLLAPLRCRIEEVALESYQLHHLRAILKMSVDKLECNVYDEALDYCIQFIQDTGRDAIMMAKKIKNFMVAEGREHMGIYDVTKMIEILGVNPRGLNDVQVNMLKTLYNAGGSGITLTSMASRLGLPNGNISGQYEPWLVKLGLMKVEGKRYITVEGKQYLRKNKIIA